jgi:prepilin-type N-terminal cleavage/methylation domain-containing protein
MMTLIRDRAENYVVNDPSPEVGGGKGRRPVQGIAGFTVLELVVVIAVVGVLASFAIPMTMGALRNYRLSAAVSAATGAISATRYQAIMHAYPYSITFNSSNATYQVANATASACPVTTVFTPLPGGPTPISGNGDVTINQTTTLVFCANGTVSATTGAMSFTISDPLTNRQHTISVTGVGDVTSN